MSTFIRLVDYDSAEKEKEFFSSKNKYVSDINSCEVIPGEPLVYQASKRLLDIYSDSKLLGDIAIARNGMKTGKNDKFIRLWWEIAVDNAMFDANSADEAIASGKKWFPYNKGGSARKWYGNNDYVVNWKNGGSQVIGDAKKDGRHVQDYPLDMKFKESITWSLINTKKPTFRIKKGNISDIAGMSFYKSGELTKYLLAICNSIISTELLKMIAPTINYQAGDIARIPVSIDSEKRPIIEALVDENIAISKSDWDEFEVSWDFKKPVLNRGLSLLKDNYDEWNRISSERIAHIMKNEKKIDELFFEIYQLDKSSFEKDNEYEATLATAEVKKDVKDLISYAVGCIMGRYSLSKKGLVYAGGNWNDTLYSTDFKPCKYGVMLITEEQYFEEDLCTRVIDFIEVVYGKDTLNDNLNFIAQSLKPGAKDPARKVIRNYLYEEKGFFDNHYQVYQHRPIYWMMSSGKAGGFRALIYMHRYNQNTLSIVRSEFLHELRYKYEADRDLQQKRVNEASTTAERNEAKKKITSLDKKMVEVNQYDDLVNHATGNISEYLFDLDDGVKVNYAKFLNIDGVKTQNLLVPIKL